MKTFIAFLISPLLTTAALHAQPSARDYLQAASDRYQSVIYVYNGPDDAGNHFPARGELDNTGGAVQVPPMDEVSLGAPCRRDFCLTATFDPRRNTWGGWYFMNGTLGSSDNQPKPNWGDIPNAGFDLSGATELRFKARGDKGGERIEFFAFGVGHDNTNRFPYRDSSAKVSLGAVTLGTTWQEYSLPVAGRDLSYVLGAFGWVADAALQPDRSSLTKFYLDDIRYIKSRPNDSRFLVSYETKKSALTSDTVLRNTAFVYDNAVALIAFTAAGDMARARAIADALLYAQSNDRYFTDGRVRNAYQGGDLFLPPGWLPNGKAFTVRMPGWSNPEGTRWFEDEFQVSTATGNVAWAMLALLYFHESTGEQKYLSGAIRMGQWVIEHASDSRGAGGFTGGYDGWELGAASGGTPQCPANIFLNGQCKRLYKSTEHNIDLYSAFSRLYLADSNNRTQWAQAARQAKSFLLSMWDAAGGKFWTGTGEDGVTTFQDVIPADVQAWAIQALGTEAQPYRDVALAYVEANHKTSRGYGFKQNGGNSCGDKTWFEGSSQVALSYLLSGNRPKWQALVSGIGSAQSMSGAMPAAEDPCVNTGFILNDGSPWLYFPRLHVGATAWLALAEGETDPFQAVLYSPSLSTSTITFAAQPIGNAATPQTVRFTNRGVSALSIQAISVSGTNSSDFSQTNTCGSTLAAGSQCEISIRFTPSVQGLRQAALVLTEKSHTAMLAAGFRVNLTGTGAAPARYNLTLQASPASGGSISATPVSVNGYDGGTRVCLVAAPNAGWILQSWSGSPLDASFCLVMDSDKAVAANFSIDSGLSRTGLHFVPIVPCRLVDTRENLGDFGRPALVAGAIRNFTVPSAACGVPASAAAYVLNATVVPKGPLGFITLWPTGRSKPFVSTLNSFDGRIKANAAIVPAGLNGAISVFATDATELVLDINGYFLPAGTSSGPLAFFPMEPCRILDTRNAAGPFGGPALAPATPRSFPIRSACGLPGSAQAYSINVTVVPAAPLSYLTVWPTGQPQPFVSTLNAPTGAIVANAAIVRAGTGGDLSFFATHATHLVVDIDGYFAPPGAPNAQRFFAIAPCRVSDTRNAAGALGGPVLGATETRQWPVPQASGCAWPSPAAPTAYSLNATVVPRSVLGFLTMWPAGQQRPLVSTLNASDDPAVANALIVPAGTAGAISSFVTDGTDLVLDANGYFAP